LTELDGRTGATSWSGC